MTALEGCLAVNDSTVEQQIAAPSASFTSRERPKGKYVETAKRIRRHSL
jgi:hypothetical protein